MRLDKRIVSSLRIRSRLVRQWLHDRLPDRWVHASQFRRKFGRRLNLAAPQTFNEKVHWLKMYYRVPELTRVSDKYEVRAFVASRVGPWLLNPLYGVWSDPQSMAAAVAELPDAFVLKVTWGSGQNILCPDKSKLDIPSVTRQLAAWMRRGEYWSSREWGYKDITPRIICERYLVDETGGVPPDYKFWCFAGDPRFIQVTSGRFTQKRVDLFDAEWRRLPFGLDYPQSEGEMPAPKHLETMISAARLLSRGFPFVRVDLYSMPEGVTFGEMTLYPYGGFTRFIPEHYDFELGQALTLPEPSRPRRLRRLRSECRNRLDGRAVGDP